MLRTIGAVVAGYVVMAAGVLLATIIATRLMLGGSMLDPSIRPTPSYLAVNVVYSWAFALLGGYLASSLAAQRRLMHASILAALILLFSLKTLVSFPAAGQPTWYPYAIAIGGSACVLVGGILRAGKR
jgi:hypothetical protein